MIDPSNDISNIDLPVAQVIGQSLSDLPSALQIALLQSASADEFVSHRVDIYLQSLEDAMQAGYDESGAKEIALKECLHGLIQNDGEVLET